MRKKIFIVSVLMIMLFISGTSAFAAVDIRLPSRLSALFEVLTNPETSAPDNITINLYGRELTVIDFSYYDNNRKTIYMFIRAGVYPFLLLFIYDNIIRFLGSARYTSPVQFNTVIFGGDCGNPTSLLTNDTTKYIGGGK